MSSYDPKMTFAYAIPVPEFYPDPAVGSLPVLELLLAGCLLVRSAGFGLGRRPAGRLELTSAGGCGAGATLRVRLLTIPAAGIGSLAELSGPGMAGGRLPSAIDCRVVNLTIVFSQSVAVNNEVLGLV